MRNLKLLGKLTCFFHGTVVLFIRLELICFSIQAERLMGQPVAAFHKFIIFLIVWFVTAAGKLHFVRKQHRKPELLCLRGKNIEKSDRTAKDFLCLSVMHRHKKNPVIKIFRHLFLDRKFCDRADRSCQLFMAVDPQISLIFSLADLLLPDHPDQPDHAQKMIDVFMGNKNIVNVFQLDPGVF